MSKMTDIIQGLTIEIASKQTKDCDATKYDIMFVQKLKTGAIEGFHLDFNHRYTDRFDVEKFEAGKKFGFEDPERFYAHLRYLIDRAAYSYVDIYVRGYKGGQRVDARRHIKNNKDPASYAKKEYILELISMYFSDLSLLKKKIEGEDGESIVEDTTSAQKKIIDDLQHKMENMSRLYDDMASQVHSDNISNISGMPRDVPKKKRRKLFGVL